MWTNIIAFLALFVSGISFYNSIQADETTMTINISELQNSKKENYYKLFVYNNDKAPCFEFTLSYDKNNFKKVFLMKDYEKSSVFNSDFDGKVISFPPMRIVPVTTNWLGYLDRTEMAYFRFYPKNISKKNKVIISCVDYEKEITFKH